MKIVDTDIFIDFFRGLPEAAAFLRQHSGEILFAAVTEAELLAGQICDDPHEHERVLHVLAQFEKVPIDNPLVEVAGDFRRKYGVEIPDALIASAAFMVDAPLVTRNIKHFEVIREIRTEEPY